MDPAAARPANDSDKDSLVRPKRPLSAFNLFYRFKRQQITDTIALGMVDKEAIVGLIKTAPGLERCPPGMIHDASPEVVAEIRRQCIRKGLVNNLLPRDSRDRSHRKDPDGMNGAMGFAELAGIMRTSWKARDELAKEVFRELADEGRKIYDQRVTEWKNATSSELALRELADKQQCSKQQLGEQSIEISQPSAKQASPKQSHPKYSPAMPPSTELTKKSRGSGKASPDLELKNYNCQDGSSVENAKAGQMTNKCSEAREASLRPASKTSHFQGGETIDCMAGAKSVPLGKRDASGNEEPARGRSSPHDVLPSSLFFEQDASKGGGGALPDDLCNFSMDRRPFQGTFIKTKKDESRGSNGMPSNLMRNSSFDRGLFQGSNDPHNTAMHLSPFLGAPRPSNSHDDLRNTAMDRGAFKRKHDLRNSSMYHGPFQGACRPSNPHNDAVGFSFFRQGATGGSNGAPPDNTFFAGSLSSKQDASGGSNRALSHHPHNASMDRGAFQASGQPGPGSPNEAEARLQARVRELEAQLSAERLRSRVRELEGELNRQSANEDLVTRQLELLSRKIRTSGPMDGTLSAQGGCWPFLSVLSSTRKARNIPPAIEQRPMYFDGNSPSSKRQRFD